MNVVTHTLVGWGLATAAPSLTRSERTWVVAAAVASDLDGFGLIVELATRGSEEPLYWWSEYHHMLGHNLLFALLTSIAAWLVTRRAAVALLVWIAVNLHLLGDLVGSRGPDGYQWPIPYLWPFSESPSLTVSWQWQLNAWPNVALSLVLLSYTFWFAWRRGSSPLELVSRRGNEVFVRALRARFRRESRNGGVNS